MKDIDIKQLLDIAFAVEEGDPIDWGVLRNLQEPAFRTMAYSIVEQFDKEDFTYDDRLIVMAVITKLTVENMILHAKLIEEQKKNKIRLRSIK